MKKLFQPTPKFVIVIPLIVLVLTLSAFTTSPGAIRATPRSSSHLASNATLVSVTSATMFVNCNQHPGATVLKNWMKYHICGYGSNSSSSAISYGSVSGSCGTVSNAVYNEGGGVAKTVVTISPSWYTGGMYKAYYGGYWVNNSTGGNDGVTGVNFWGPLPSFNWTDPQYFYTDTGNVTFTVDSEAATTVFFGECTLVAPISASVRVTI